MSHDGSRLTRWADAENRRRGDPAGAGGQDGITKIELVEYYRTIGPHILPHLRERPINLERFPLAYLANLGCVTLHAWLRRSAYIDPMFPYRDDNPTLGTPAVTYLLIGLNAAVWVLVQGMGAEPQLSKSVCELGLIPGEFLGRIPEGYTLPMSPTTACELGADRSLITPLSSMFLHGGWFHLIGNMW